MQSSFEEASEKQRREELNNLMQHVLSMSDQQVQAYLVGIAEETSQSETSLPEISQSAVSAYACTEEQLSENWCFERHGSVYHWRRSPSTFLVCAKPDDRESQAVFEELVMELKRSKITVLVDSQYSELLGCAAFQKNQLNPECIDLVIVVGGDGSLLYVNELFTQSCPPIVALNAGSLGFLAPFGMQNVPATVQFLLNGPLIVVERRRFHAFIQKGSSALHLPRGTSGQIYKHPAAQQQNLQQLPQYRRSGLSMAAYASEVESSTPHPQPRFQPPFGTKLYSALNEVYVHRGYSPYLTNLLIYQEGLFVGNIQADGLIVATATGSTAYSLSAGGVPVSPSLDCILLTPVCPHVMASKPLVLKSAVLKIKVSKASRGAAAVSFDGRNTVELKPGDSVVIDINPHFVPTVCARNETSDWFGKLRSALGWNVRIEQKAFSADGQSFQKERCIGDLDSDLEV